MSVRVDERRRARHGARVHRRRGRRTHDDSAALGQHDDSLATRRSLGVVGVGSDRADPAAQQGAREFGDVCGRPATPPERALSVAASCSLRELSRLRSRASRIADPSESHPDDSTTQLRALQTLLLRMQRGKLPETAPTFVDAIRLPSDVKIRPNAWKKLVADSFIWIDYLSVRFCVPQLITRLCFFLTFFMFTGSSNGTRHSWRAHRPREGQSVEFGLRREV